MIENGRLQLYGDENESVEVNLNALPASYATNLGYEYETGDGYAPQDYPMALALYQYAAGHGSAEAENNLGWMYLNGMGVNADLCTAMRYFYRAASHENDTAMVNLGNFFEDQKDYSSAWYWYDRAAGLDNPVGAFNSANLEFHGWGTERQLEKAYATFRKLYDDGYHNGPSFYLAYYAQFGLLGAPDPVAAKRYYAEGAALGDVNCMTNLAIMHLRGELAKPDLRHAYLLLQGAAELGDALAYTKLADMYETGQFVEEDHAEALKLYHKAAEMGEIHAIEYLQKLDEGE